MQKLGAARGQRVFMRLACRGAGLQCVGLERAARLQYLRMGCARGLRLRAMGLERAARLQYLRMGCARGLRLRAMGLERARQMGLWQLRLRRSPGLRLPLV